jgi:hypothetical protein
LPPHRHSENVFVEAPGRFQVSVLTAWWCKRRILLPLRRALPTAASWARFSEHTWSAAVTAFSDRPKMNLLRDLSTLRTVGALYYAIVSGTGKTHYNCTSFCRFVSPIASDAIGQVSVPEE